MKNNFTLSIITHNRPEFLKTAAKSIVSRLNKNKMNEPLAVFDDSIETKIIEENLITVEEIKKDLYPNISYFGKKEKELFLGDLFKKINALGIDKELLEFAIYGSVDPGFRRDDSLRRDNLFCWNNLKGPGGNRNISILRSAGKKLISFDDDIEIIPIQEKKTQHSYIYNISFDNNPEINFFDDLKKAEKHLSKFIDPITSFFETTGTKVTDINGKINTNETGYNIEKTNNKIIAAMSGLYGGRWFSRINNIFTNNGEFRKSSYKNKSSYIKIKTNPIATLLSSSIKLSDIPFFITSACSIDLSQGGIPPFPPLGRSEDSIWALLALYINKNSFLAYLPTAIFHTISNKADFTEKNYTTASPDLGLINFLIIDYIKTRESLLSLPPSLPYIGRQIKELADCSDADWIDFCNMIWLKYTGIYFEDIENALSVYRKKPKFWALDVFEYMEVIKKQILMPSNSLPYDLRINNNIEDVCKLHKLFLRQYGKLLEAWSLIMEEAFVLSKEREG